MKDNLFALRKTCAGLLILCISGLTLFGQGQLPPPGAPGPTMKTLDQIDTHVGQAGEKRIPVNATNTPGDAEAPFVITQPGSYYLTGNLTSTQHAGIKIAAAGVTLDLNGFQVTGTAAGTGGGIEITQPDCVVKNGSITGFGGSGIAGNSVGTLENVVVSNCHNGIAVDKHWLITNCIANGNQNGGISTGDNSRLQNCSANSNKDLHGISLGASCTVTDCTASLNGGPGIAALDHCIVSHCNASKNVGFGFFFGIQVGAGSTVVDCTAGANAAAPSSANASSGGGIRLGKGSTLSNCSAEGNNGDGIQAGESCTVAGCTSTNNGTGTIGSGIVTDIRANISGCTAIGNKTDGILFSGDSFVLNNHASKNGGAGFHDIGSASRIEGNVARENLGLGISAATIDTVVRNNSGANGNSAPNNQYGPTVGPNWGPTGATANTSTSPWANF